MDAEKKRLKLDVMIPLFTHTFTEKFDEEQEYLVAEKLVEYRDWLAMVAGEKVCEDYHFVLMDTPLARQDIWEIEKNRFWMSAHDTWQQLQKTGLNPSSYDLVWSMWAWKNIDDAKQMYGGGALLGPDTTPFMSFSVSRFQKRDPGITMVLEHEAQHTYEMLFFHTGQKVVTELPLDGFPHADFLDTFLEEMLRREPGLFEPFMSDEEALQHRRGGAKGWPGFTLQRAVNAWTHSIQPKERYLKIAERFGQIVSIPEVEVEPVFASFTVVTDRPERRVVLPVRIRFRGEHVPGVRITGRTTQQVVVFEEDSYYRHEKIRMPKKECWSVGWEGNGYYVGSFTVSKETKSIDLQVEGPDFAYSFTIPVTYISAVTEENSPGEPISLDGQPIDGGQVELVSPGGSVVYRLPVKDYGDATLKLAGQGQVQLKLSITGRYFVPVWKGEVNGEVAAVKIPYEVLKQARELYVRLQLPKEQEKPFTLGRLSLVGTRYV